MKRVLVSCPPMLGMIDEFIPVASRYGLDLIPASMEQALSEQELIGLLPEYDGWIIGDDPATRDVFEAGYSGKLRAAVKWGVGTDNVDFEACTKLGIPVGSTPNMFGAEVADLAVAYLLGLARQSYLVDREIRTLNAWPKPAGISISESTVGVLGYGDIGFHLAQRLTGFGARIVAWDPGVEGNRGLESVERHVWPDALGEVDFLVLACALTPSSYHVIDSATLPLFKHGAHIVNVARGGLINEADLVKSLQRGEISAVALDVFEEEPLPENSLLRTFPRCIFGSHNGSNTISAVRRASHRAIEVLAGYFNE